MEITKETSKIRTMFDGIAPNYDKLNRIMTARLDLYWRKRLISCLRKERPQRILDVACGTGDLSFMMASRISECQEVVGVDLSSEMLSVARRKMSAKKNGYKISFLQGDCLHLPFAEETFSAATCAFGVRNFENTEQGLREMARVLIPKGSLFILELSTPPNKFLRWGYRLYAHRVIPFLGKWFAHDMGAYEYLPLSIESMPQRMQMVELICRSGFSSARYLSLSGGIATLYIAHK